MILCPFLETVIFKFCLIRFRELYYESRKLPPVAVHPLFAGCPMELFLFRAKTVDLHGCSP